MTALLFRFWGTCRSKTRPIGSLRAGGGLQLLLDLREIERAGRLAGWIVLHRLQEFPGHRLDRHKDIHTVEEPIVVAVRVVLRLLERIAPQVEKERHAQLRERLAP